MFSAGVFQGQRGTEVSNRSAGGTPMSVGREVPGIKQENEDIWKSFEVEGGGFNERLLAKDGGDG